MKRSIIPLFLFFSFIFSGVSNAQETADTRYGDNKAIGKYVELNGAGSIMKNKEKGNLCF